MGKRNREKRAAKAKQRAQAHGGPTRSRHDVRGDVFDEELYAEAQRHSLLAAVRAAAHAHVQMGPDVTADRMETLSAAVQEMGVRKAFLHLDQMLLTEVREMWKRGWLPVDVFQLVRRRVGREAASLAVDVIAAECACYAPATVHPRWRDQLTEIGATVWWDRAEPLLSQWARRHGHEQTATLVAVVAVIGDLAFAGTTTPILPSPGNAQDSPDRRAGVDEKVLARVRGLLAKAESTDYPDEAEALSAKAQELMNRHALDRASAEATERASPVVNARRIWLESPYLAEKAHLVSAVAGANRCRSVLAEKPGFLTLVGDELDLDSAELLATSLLVQASRAMLAERKGTGQANTRAFRQSFLISYAVRIGERLHAVTDLDESVSQALVPVFADRERAVADTMDALFPQMRARSFTARDQSGWVAGHAAADRARLTLEREALLR
ncbi:DUF2786 domain-containing protein [Allokutzneria sp. A3M-2-11 16]|uniref:DUF2786 domain-containing protein n=1 Tax=Allokutzneria sp. A3M-2-11 16 TaxID=2962043 RepID=UPI0020B8FC8A|nr:DUF2786 domain-containing protein [Allokutzneria sp. A3M-2-11 16]MCP3800754.1 DUF2786 domain-containing protein [Allokutzneria sp. A3M-2-11 16]